MINYFDKLKNVFIFMPRLSISLLIIFLLMSVNKCHGDYYDDYPYPDDYYDDNDYNDNNYYDNFNETLKNYLVENGYFDSDRLIEPYEMKKILYEVISEGDPDKNSENVKKIFSQLAERFTEVYYNDRKQIFYVYDSNTKRKTEQQLMKWTLKVPYKYILKERWIWAFKLIYNYAIAVKY